MPGAGVRGGLNRFLQSTRSLFEAPPTKSGMYDRCPIGALAPREIEAVTTRWLFGPTRRVGVRIAGVGKSRDARPAGGGPKQIRPAILTPVYHAPSWTPGPSSLPRTFDRAEVRMSNRNRPSP